MSAFSTYIPTVADLKRQVEAERKADLIAEDNKKAANIMKEIKKQMKDGKQKLELSAFQIPSCRKTFAQILEERGFRVSAWHIFESQIVSFEEPKSIWTISWD